MIDLHIHSCYSDGSDTIEEIIAQAKKLQLKQIAISDHNTIAGALIARNYQSEALDIVCGIEISCDILGEEVHMLGYFPSNQSDFSALYELIAYNEKMKYDSQLEMIDRLSNYGIYFTYDDMKKEYPNVILNRVHIANMIVKSQFAKDVDDAFEQYLKKGRPCYVNSQRVSAFQAIEAIHRCHGLAYLAHPYKYKQTYEILDILQEQLDGIEVIHSSFSKAQSDALMQYAHQHHLKMSGGSDYHGCNKKDVNLGQPLVEDCHSIVF